MLNVGDRVGAVLSADSGVVKLLGFGVYSGHFKPDVQCLGFDPEDLPDGFVNPKIQLDDGRVVWGCQCWWGPEEWVRNRMIGDRKVVTVGLDGEELTVSQYQPATEQPEEEV